MREHDRAGFRLYGVVRKFLAVGVSAEVKLLNGGTEGGAVLKGLEIVMGGFGVGEELPARGVGIVVAHKAETVLGVGQEGGSGFIGRGVLDEHSAAEQVNTFLREVSSGTEVEFEGFDAHAFEHF